MSSVRPTLALAITVAAFGRCGSRGDDVPVTRALVPAVTADIVAPRGEGQQAYTQRQVLLINKWVRQTGLPPSASAALLDVVRDSRRQSPKFVTQTGDQLLVALQVWLKAAQARDSLRQAAAYLVADRVLRLAWRPFQLGDTASAEGTDLRKRLKALGAASEFSEGEFTYAGGWLQDAARLDAGGPMGQRAALLQLETDCAGGDSPASYYSIARRLDPLVAAPADSEVKSTAQLLQADAYRDIVALAYGLGKDNADSSQFLPVADSAKAQAIALYQASLSGDSTSQLAHGGQAALARLTSGLPPDHLRFFCFAE